MPQTQNLGQVAGLFIGNSAPSNTTLIWYDSTPGICLHKVYDIRLSSWVVLDDEVISAIEYSALTHLAQTDGLTVGQRFQITDPNLSVLATAITTTKVQYTNSLGNIVIDDLGHGKSYIVSSDNLLIDDVNGVYDVANNKLVFSFQEETPTTAADYFIFGKAKINNVWKLVKYRVNKFLSTESGNSIQWRNGFFFDFLNSLRALYDQPGGIVSKTAFDNNAAQVNNQIQNVANNIQNVVNQSTQAVNAATTDEQIYDKQIPANPNDSFQPVDISQGDSLLTIIRKIARFIHKFSTAKGITMPPDYAESSTIQVVSNQDNVSTAIGKLSYAVRNLQGLQGNGTDSVIVSPEYNDNPTSDNKSGAGSVLTRLLEKLRFYSLKHETTDGIKVSNNFYPDHAEEPIAPGTTVLTRLLANLQYWVNQFKTTNGIKLDSSYSPANNTITAGTTSITDVLEKIMFEINKLNTWYDRGGKNIIVPKGTTMMYTGNIDFDTFYDAVGYGWLPSGVVAVSKGDNSFWAEKSKWASKYTGIQFEVVTIGYDGSTYTYGLTILSYNGLTLPKVGANGAALYAAAFGDNIGTVTGSDSVTLKLENLPKHNHDKAQPANTSGEGSEVSVSVDESGLHHHRVYAESVSDGGGYIKQYLSRSVNPEEKQTPAYYEYGYNNKAFVENAGSHKHTFKMYSRGNSVPINIRPMRVAFHLITKVE